ncbi:MAG: phosphoglucosamine mutase [Bacillota bacterium]|nr:phosphoglucosamine mutase [Bacillota bacterium]
MTRKFGTDGVRGIANLGLSAELALGLGRAGARVLAGAGHRRPRILLGRDTRLSGDMLEAALTAGLESAGADVVTAGVLPTPAVAVLTVQGGFDAGIVISASHNPFAYNGIKFFSADGSKLPDAVEDQIESELLGLETVEPPTGLALGRHRHWPEAAAAYRDWLLAQFTPDLKGLRIGLDMAHGAAAEIAPPVFRALGAEIVCIGDAPDGANINAGCGSTALDPLRTLVLERGLDIGFAYDGDADRCLAIDRTGRVADGDHILAVLARWLESRGCLPADTVVATVMSNMGLERALAERGVRLVRSRVGDRYVLEDMRRTGARLGGEQSGHVILLDWAPGGDGVLTSLALLTALLDLGETLETATSDFVSYPQVQRQAAVSAGLRERVLRTPERLALERRHLQELGDTGRLLLRPSGTEPVLRIMYEGQDLYQITAMADEMLALINALAARDARDGTVAASEATGWHGAGRAESLRTFLE